MRTVAKRYAKALAMFCKEKGYDYDEVYTKLKELSNALLSDVEFYKLLTVPVVSQREKLEAAKEYISKVDVPDYIKNFFLLLVEKGRLSALPFIVDEFRAIADELMGQVRGVLKVAVEISPEEKAQLESVFSEKLGKKVVLEVEEDPSIIGGAVAHIGGVVFDGSIIGNLEIIKEKLVER